MVVQDESCRFKWIVLMASTATYALSYGTIHSVGVLYPEWIRTFNSKANYVSFVGSFPSAFGCLIGPVGAFAVEKAGSRVCGILGGIFMFVGLILCYFANSVLHLFFSFGIITGIGAGLSLVTFSSVVNGYFTYDRSLAEGVIGGGVCLGIFTASIMIQQFMLAYAWRGTMLLLAGYCLNICVFAMFFIPKSEITNHPFNRWRTSDQKRTPEAVELNILPENKLKLVPEPKSHHREHFLIRSRRLWKRPLFLLISASDFLTWCAMLIPLVHLVERARQHGVNANVAAWLSSTIGLSGIVGRPLLGALCTITRTDPFWAYASNQALLAVAVFMSPFWSDVYGFFVIAVVYGLLSNGYGFMKASVASMLGQDNFVDAYSWIMFIEGIGICVGPFIAGSVVDVTQSYDWSFRFCGLLLLVSASICLLRNPLKRLESRLL